MEPRTARPARRLKAIEQLAAAGVPVGVLVVPVVPGLTDEEVPQILTKAARRGATRAGYVMLRLPGAVEDLFVEWVHREFPERADRILRRLRSLRGSRMSDSRFKVRMRGEGAWARVINHLFHTTCRRLGLNEPTPALRTDLFLRTIRGQLGLFA